MKLRTKMLCGFMAMTLLSAILGTVGLVSTITLNGISTELFVLQAEQDSVSNVLNAHYVWRQKLTEAVLAGKDFTGSLDPNTCALGQWYESDHSKNVKDDELRNSLKRLDEPHAFIHNEARNIVAMVQAGDIAGAKDLLENEIFPKTNEVITILTTMQMRYISLVEAKSIQSTDIAHSMEIVNIGLIIAAIAIGLIMALKISNSISAPISTMTEYMSKAGQTGDLELTPNVIKQINTQGSGKDEIALLSNGAAAFAKRMIDVSNKLEQVADGDLTVDIELLSNTDTMGSSMTQMLHNFNDMLVEIRNTTDQVSAGAGQIADGAQSLAEGSTEQASAVEELSSSIGRINEMAKSNSDNATAALDAVQKAGNELGECTVQMKQMMAAMKIIDDKSRDILKTTKIIDDIAFQTNILALNAAVEAARAGQHGKGFAVVAEEVRNLASKSAEAARETALLLESSTHSVDEGNKIVEKVNDTMDSVVENANKNAEFIASVQSVSIEQSKAMKYVSDEINRVAQVVAQNSATAEESAAASMEMSRQSNILQQLTTQFKMKEAEPVTHEEPFEDDLDHKLIKMPKKSSFRLVQ